MESIFYLDLSFQKLYFLFPFPDIKKCHFLHTVISTYDISILFLRNFSLKNFDITLTDKFGYVNLFVVVF